MADNKNQKKQPVYETPEELYQRALAILERDPLIVKQAFRAENYRKAAKLFHLIPDYQDSAEQEKKCLKLADLADEKELENRYNRAVEMKQEASTEKGYEKAISQLKTVPGYRDADALLAECEQKHAAFSHSNKIRKSTVLAAMVVLLCGALWFFQSSTWNQVWLYITTGSTTGKPAAQNSKEVLPLSAETAKGDIVTFGPYKWYVLEREDDRARLLLNHAEKYAMLREQPYHTAETEVTWADSSLRSWLNQDFLQENFSEEEQDRILTVPVKAIANPTYGTDGGEDTEDKVTLLAPDEITEYMEQIKNIKMNIWLRAPGNTNRAAMFMSSRHSVMEYGYSVSSTDFYVCPVIWASLEEAASNEK